MNEPVLEHRITLEGILFILFAFAIGFAAYNTGNSLLYLILSMMLAFLAFSGFMAYQMLNHLEARRRVPDRIFARTPTHVGVELRNRKRLMSSYSLRLRDEIATDGEAGNAYVLSLPPRGSVETDYLVSFPRRGIHRLGLLHIYTRYPFGFLERHLALPMQHEVLIFPKIHAFRRSPTASLVRLGERPSPRRGEGTDLRALRLYQPDDPARIIHWKASAKSGEMIAKEMEREAQARYDLLLNNALPGPIDPRAAEDFELAVEFAASLAVYLAERGMAMTLFTRSGTLTFGGAQGELTRVFRTLALLPLLESDVAPPMPRHAGSDILVQLGYASTEERMSPRYVPLAEWQTWLADVGAPAEVAEPSSAEAVASDPKAA